MNYYTVQMLVFQEVDKKLAQVQGKNEPVSVNSIVLELTKRFPVSPKAIEKRINMFVSEHSNILELKNGEVCPCQ